jgi:hypothetical protein
VTRATVLLVALTALITACGGSPRLSRGELARRATKICVEQARTIAKIPRGPATALNASGYLGAVLSVVEKGLKQFHALRPPADEQGTYNALLRELDRNVNILRDLRGAAAANDRKDYEIGLGNLHRSRLRINALERRLGLTGCVGSGA